MAKRKRKAAPDPAADWRYQQKARINTLALYNAERARGIVHTPEWDEQMAKCQAWFDEETAAHAQCQSEDYARRRRGEIGLPPEYEPGG